MFQLSKEEEIIRIYFLKRDISKPKVEFSNFCHYYTRYTFYVLKYFNIIYVKQ